MFAEASSAAVFVGLAGGASKIHTSLSRSAVGSGEAGFAEVVCCVALLVAATIGVFAATFFAEFGGAVTNLASFAFFVIGARSALVEITDLSHGAILGLSAVGLYAALVQAQRTLVTVGVLGTTQASAVDTAKARGALVVLGASAQFVVDVAGLALLTVAVLLTPNVTSLVVVTELSCVAVCIFLAASAHITDADASTRTIVAGLACGCFAYVVDATFSIATFFVLGAGPASVVATDLSLWAVAVRFAVAFLACPLFADLFEVAVSVFLTRDTLVAQADFAIGAVGTAEAFFFLAFSLLAEEVRATIRVCRANHALVGFADLAVGTVGVGKAGFASTILCIAHSLGAVGVACAAFARSRAGIASALFAVAVFEALVAGMGLGVTDFVGTTVEILQAVFADVIGGVAHFSGVAIGVVAASSCALARLAHSLGAALCIVLAGAACVVATDLAVRAGCVRSACTIALLAGLVDASVGVTAVFAVFARGAFVGDTRSTIGAIRGRLAPLWETEVVFACVIVGAIGDGLAPFQADAASTNTAGAIAVLCAIRTSWGFHHTARQAC